MHTSKRTLLICLLWVIYGSIWLIPAQAQTFGNTPITIENASQLTLMATYNHMFPAIIATSPDGRWLAVGRRFPEGGGPGGGDDFTLYHAPPAYYDPTAILVYDLQNLTDEPQILSGNNRYIKQMTFTATRLLVLTSNADEDQYLMEWEIDGDTFINPYILIEDIDTAFAVDENDTWMIYFFEGGIYYDTLRRPPEQIGQDLSYGPPIYENPISLSAGTINTQTNDYPIAVVVDQNLVERLGNIEKPGFYLAQSGTLVTRGLGRAYINQANVYYADDTTINIDVEVANYPIVDVAPHKIIDFAAGANWDLFAAIVTDGDTTQLYLLNTTGAYDPYTPPVNTMEWGVTRENLNHVEFSVDNTKLITVAGSEVAIWSVPENLLTQSAAFGLSQENVLAYCTTSTNVFKNYPQSIRLGVVWSWFATDEGLIQDHIKNAKYDVRIDDTPLYQWTFVTQVITTNANNHNPTVYYYTPIGTSLYPSQHRISFNLTWLKSIHDGYQAFGPGTDIPSDDGECNIMITD